MLTATPDRDPSELIYIDMPDPDDPTAPHETGGLVRANRCGMKGPDVVSMVRGAGRTAASVIEEMQRTIDQETDARYRGVPIHDAGIENNNG